MVGTIIAPIPVYRIGAFRLFESAEPTLTGDAEGLANMGLRGPFPEQELLTSFALADSPNAAYVPAFELRPNGIGLAARCARLTNDIPPISNQPAALSRGLSMHVSRSTQWLTEP